MSTFMDFGAGSTASGAGGGRRGRGGGRGGRGGGKGHYKPKVKLTFLSFEHFSFSTFVRS